MDIWNRFIAGEKIAICTGEKHRLDMLKIAYETGLRDSYRIDIAENEYKDETVLCFSCHFYAGKLMSFSSRQYYEEQGFEIVDFDDVFNPPTYDLSDFDTLFL
jgi:hypothetical protein